jgi:RNA polymerase subunit RPABC4/transcription elongation factor Spt4
MATAFIILIPIGLIRALLRLVFGGFFKAGGRTLGMVVGPIAGPVMDRVAGPSGTCPHCGFLVGAQASSCAQCGYTPSLARSELALPFTSVSSRPAQAARTGPILPMGQCPNCEEIIPMSSKSCPVCRHVPDPQGSVPA